MTTFPNFRAPNMNVQANSAFAPAQIDFSQIGRLADSYYGAQEGAIKRQTYQEEQAAKAAERERQAKLRSAFSGGLPTGPDGQLDFSAMAKRAAESGLLDQATSWATNASQAQDRAATRDRQDRTLAMDQEYKRAQIEKMRREAAEGTTYGKTGSIFQGPDNKFYSIQFGGDGSRVILPLEVPGQGQSAVGPTPSQQPLPQSGAERFAAPGMAAAQPSPMPLTPSRGVSVVGDQMYDSATGAPVRSVGANIAEAERQKIIGRETGEGQASLPKLQNAYREYDVKNRSVMQNIVTALDQANAWTTGFVGNIGRQIAGTPAHDLSKTLISIQANLGFETLQQMRDNSPTGGALGQVTERELELLQSAWTSLAQSQSPRQFRDNLLKLKQIKEQYAAIKRRAYDADVKRFGAANVPTPSAPSGASSNAPAFDPLGIR